MSANKVRGVRCALCWSEESARLSRQHNDANVLSLGQRLVPEALALAIVRVGADDSGQALLQIAPLRRQTRQHQGIGRAMRQREGRAVAGFQGRIGKRRIGLHKCKTRREASWRERRKYSRYYTGVTSINRMP